jgi:hypothetical protein
MQTVFGQGLDEGGEELQAVLRDQHVQLNPHHLYSLVEHQVQHHRRRHSA